MRTENFVHLDPLLGITQSLAAWQQHFLSFKFQLYFKYKRYDR
jgi:hypothetical protein